MAFGGWGAGGGGGAGLGGGGGGPMGAMRRAADGWSDEALGKAYDHKVVVRLLKYAAPYKMRLIIGIIGTLVFSAASYTQPLVVGIDSVGHGQYIGNPPAGSARPGGGQ